MIFPFLWLILFIPIVHQFSSKKNSSKKYRSALAFLLIFQILGQLYFFEQTIPSHSSSFLHSFSSYEKAIHSIKKGNQILSKSLSSLSEKNNIFAYGLDFPFLSSKTPHTHFLKARLPQILLSKKGAILLINQSHSETEKKLLKKFLQKKSLPRLRSYMVSNRTFF